MNYPLCVLGPAFLTGFAAILVWYSLRSSQVNRRWLFLPGLLLLVLVCFWMMDVASSGGLGAVNAFVLALFAAIIAVVAGLWLISSLVGWRKVAALLIGVVFPAALFVSIRFGDSRSPDAATRRNGNAIVQALESYYEDEGVYPVALVELVPKHLANLPQESSSWTWFYCETEDDSTQQYVEPDSTSGWLYCATANDFVFGYVFWVDRYRYGVYVYKSETSKWEYLSIGLNSTASFVIGPTRSPDERWNVPPSHIRRSTPTP